MSRSFTSKSVTSRGGRGRDKNLSNFGRGSIINRGENEDKQRESSKLPLSGIAIGHSSINSTPTRPNPSRGITRNRTSKTTRSVRGQGRGGTMYDNDDMSYNSGSRMTDDNSQSNQPRPQGSTNTGRETNTGSTTHSSGFTMVSPNEKKRRAITEQATKNLQEYERHKEERRIQHVSYVGTAGGGLISEEEARRKAAIENSKASYYSRIKRDSFRAAEKEKEEMMYREKKMAARRQSELNEERRKKEDSRHKDEMRRKNAAFLDRLEANKPKPNGAKTNQDTDVSRVYKSVPTRSSVTKELSSETKSYANDAVNEDLKRLQVMFPHYTSNDLSELLQQMGSLELTVDILSE